MNRLTTSAILTLDDDRAENRRVISFIEEYDAEEIGTIQRKQDYIGGLEDKNERVVWVWKPTHADLRAPFTETVEGSYTVCEHAAEKAAKWLVQSGAVQKVT